MRQAYKNRVSKRNASIGFTIVELLIVVVVIAILATITIVAYNGISNQAKESALKADLKNASTQLHIVKSKTGAFPDNADDLQKSEGANFNYISEDDNTFCISVSNMTALPDTKFFITESSSIQEGDCGAGMATTMQTFTSDHCASLSVFTGANTEAVVELTDSRGGITQTYEVAKLADDNCWMLGNLKLGSTTSSITLTPDDSDVSADFTLPQVTTAGTQSYDEPRAYGPTPGDTGSGSTNYGYLYNWPAATAGESQTTMPAGSGNAPESICPANWRLPTGSDTPSGNTSGEFSQLDIAFGGTGMPAGGPSLPSWKYSGAFRGVLSGNWWVSFGSQGSNGNFWSSSASPSSSAHAFRAYFDADIASPGGTFYRVNGVGVRCLLN